MKFFTYVDKSFLIPLYFRIITVCSPTPTVCLHILFALVIQKKCLSKLNPSKSSINSIINMSSKESCDSVHEIPTDEMNKKRLTFSLLKAIVYLCNVGGLIWWSIRSINTYNEWPTASKVEIMEMEN